MKMNKYEAPEIKVMTLDVQDILTNSPGDAPTVDWEW